MRRAASNTPKIIWSFIPVTLHWVYTMKEFTRDVCQKTSLHLYISGKWEQPVKYPGYTTDTLTVLNTMILLRYSIIIPTRNGMLSCVKMISILYLMYVSSSIISLPAWHWWNIGNDMVMFIVHRATSCWITALLDTHILPNSLHKWTLARELFGLGTKFHCQVVTLYRVLCTTKTIQGKCCYVIFVVFY